MNEALVAKLTEIKNALLTRGMLMDEVRQTTLESFCSKAYPQKPIGITERINDRRQSIESAARARLNCPANKEKPIEPTVPKKPRVHWQLVRAIGIILVALGVILVLQSCATACRAITNQPHDGSYWAVFRFIAAIPLFGAGFFLSVYAKEDVRYNGEKPGLRYNWNEYDKAVREKSMYDIDLQEWNEWKSKDEEVRREVSEYVNGEYKRAYETAERQYNAEMERWEAACRRIRETRAAEFPEWQRKMWSEINNKDEIINDCKRNYFGEKYFDRIGDLIVILRNGDAIDIQSAIKVMHDNDARNQMLIDSYNATVAAEERTRITRQQYEVERERQRAEEEERAERARRENEFFDRQLKLLEEANKKQLEAQERANRENSDAARKQAEAAERNAAALAASVCQKCKARAGCFHVGRPNSGCSYM